jgi:hypothetical protein
MEIITKNDIPDWLEYPSEYLRLVEDDLVRFSPWYLLNSKLAKIRYDGLRKRYPDRNLFAFAARLDNDDIACWEQGSGSQVLVMHDFAADGYTNRRVFETFWDWFRNAIEDMIQHEV